MITVKPNRLRAALLLLAICASAYGAAATQDVGETETRDQGQIRFARGASSTTVRGNLPRGFRDQYLVRARPGQWMSVRLDSEDPGMGFDVFVTEGLGAEPVTEADKLQREWVGRLPQGDEYYINVMTAGRGAAYSFEVSITNARPARRPAAPADNSGASGSPVAKELRTVLSKIKAEGAGGVPVLLPGELPASVLEDRLYVEGGASDRGYDISLALTPRCGANACTVGSFSAERGGELVEEFERVELAGGLRGAYKPLTCGASCSPAMIEWVAGGVLYSVQLKLNAGGDAGDRAALIALANSAIKAGPR
ncbi:MAG TPA: hypothetical protein VD968_14895 [Pyrinomonadaceae bacterium]|nr:hypothetical protein [Pyrinomonadaceae bacterium]